MKVTIPEVLDRFVAYRRKELAWGSLHIVLDDGNTDDDDVAFCIKYAREHNDPEGGPQQRRVRLTDLRGRPQAHRRPCPQGHDVCEHGEDHDLRRFALRFSGLSEEEQAQLLA